MCHPTWTPGDVIAIETVRIDLDDYETALKKNLFFASLNWFVSIFVVLLVIHWLFRAVIVRRLEKLLQVFMRVEKGNFAIADILGEDAPIDRSSHNEIDQLFYHLVQMVDALRPVIVKVVSQSMIKNIDGVVQNAAQTESIFIRLRESSQKVEHYFGEIEQTQKSTIETMRHFDEEFEQEQTAFEQILQRLEGITKENATIIESTHNVERVMEMICEESAELKVLSDGFETITNQGTAPRTIVSPPVAVTVQYEDGVKEHLYLFDLFDAGVAFFAIDPHSRCNRNSLVGHRGVLYTEKRIGIDERIAFEVVYQSEPKLHGIRFCGAKKI